MMTTGVESSGNDAGVTKIRPKRRRRGPGWVPNQHGAWAMLTVPLVVGAIRSGLTWEHLLLLVAWFSAYFAFYATGLWLKSRRKARYRPPVIAYAVSTAALGLPLIAWHPELVRWAVVFGPLLLVSLGYSVRRDDRAILNDLLTTGAAAVMVVVAGGLGRLGTAPSDLGDLGAAWFPGGGDPDLWRITLVVFLYFAGTAFYVKTMIRERGSRGWLIASVAWHALTLAVAVLAWPTAAWLMAIALVRAVVVPWRLPRATAAQIGYGEVVVSVALTVVLVVT